MQLQLLNSLGRYGKNSQYDISEAELRWQVHHDSCCAFLK